MTRQEQIRFVALHSLGNFLLLFSLYGVFATFGPFISEQTKFVLLQVRGVEFQVVRAADSQDDASVTQNPPSQTAAQQRSFVDILAADKEQILVPPDPAFSILVPKIGASSRVFPNVDPDNKDEYLSVLKSGVAHAKGSVFPGYPGNTYLFAHSADNWWDVGHYNAVFYTLNNLSENDEIVVFFENRRYTYKVTQKVISSPENTTYLTGQQEGQHRLVLQTCWPPGTTFQRLYVIAEPISVQ
jgi:LPXTG-site transpeptidase (sortase) family protein